ncbi:AraC family transcriptional regulator [Clostridiales bacterium COT073_COT-073]|nr:AraC family transcriptional regulator [Clostridiales bacterium COT073_COT-073]
MKHKNILLNHMFRYFLGFLLIFICSVSVALVASKVIEKYILERSELKVQEGIKKIQETFTKLDLITQIISKNEAFTMIAYQNGAIPKERVTKLKTANRLFNEVGLTTESSPYMFALFQNNDIYLSNSQSSFDFNKYYNQFLSLQITENTAFNSDQLKNFLFEQHVNHKKIIPLNSSSYIYNGKQQVLNSPLLYLSQYNSGTHPLYVICYLLDKNYIIRQILMPEFKDNSFLKVVDSKTGENILEYGEIPMEIIKLENRQKTNTHYTIANINEKLQWKVVIGIPRSFIYEQLQPVQHILYLFLIAGLLLVVGLTIYFSFYRYRKLKQVLFAFSNMETNTLNEETSDEYRLLLDRISYLNNQRNRYRQDAEQLIYQNEAILLEHLIISGIRTAEERSVFERCFKKQPEFFCVALVQLQEKNYPAQEAITLEMVNFFQNQHNKRFANVYTGISDEIFLFEIDPQNASNVTEIEALFHKLIRDITAKYHVTVHVGISAIGTDITNINKCYEQARQMVQAQYRYTNENIIMAYDISLNALYENPVNLDFLNRLYHLLLCGQKEDAIIEIVKLENYFIRMPYLYEIQKEQVYYTIRNTLYSAWLNLNCKDRFEKIIPQFDKTIDNNEYFGCFKKAICHLDDFIMNNKKSQNEELKLKIIEYLHVNYHNPELSAYSVSREMGISEKYLFSFIKEQTGETFANYLLSIRIEKAKEYLSNKTLSNEKIAALTGFGSVNTFYRNFKSQMGVSPKVYQEKNNSSSYDLLYDSIK